MYLCDVRSFSCVLAGVTGFAVVTPMASSLHAQAQPSAAISSTAVSPRVGQEVKREVMPEVRVELTQAPRALQIRPGQPTTVWSYTGKLVSGPATSLTQIANSYLGPTIHAWTGQQVSILCRNELGEPSVTHWHGLDVPADMDGHPSYAIPSGSTYQYKFPILNRAGTYWYHPHPDLRTAAQVQLGLAGFFLVHDEEERKLNLPSGAYDLPLCIQDRTFDADNQLVYNPNMKDGFFGTTMCVNGQPDSVHATASRVHRLRLLNGSTSRIFKLAFSDATPMVVIGNDGGLLAAPETKPYVMLAPGERVEIWADFRGKAVGTQITLRSLAFSGAGGGQGEALDVMRFAINEAVTEERLLPAKLSTIERYRLEDAINASNPRTYAIGAIPGIGDGVTPDSGEMKGMEMKGKEMKGDGMQGMEMKGMQMGGKQSDRKEMAYTLNGGVFEMTAVAANEVARCNTLEVIRVTNTSGVLEIAHPIHFHGRQFQVLDRTVKAEQQAGVDTVKDGYIDSGWKDTILIMPGETVRFLVKHGGYPGIFNYHCHNLEHEDMGMMRNFRLDP